MSNGNKHYIDFLAFVISVGSVGLVIMSAVIAYSVGRVSRHMEETNNLLRKADISRNLDSISKATSDIATNVRRVENELNDIDFKLKMLDSTLMRVGH